MIGTRARLAVCGAIVGLSACTGSLFQSKAPPSTLYLLSPPPAVVDAGTGVGAGAVAGAADCVDLVVLEPRVRAGLQSDRITIVYPDRHLDHYADARWSGPLDRVVQDLSVQIFRSNARLRNVAADSSPFASAFWLELEVIDFEAEYVTDSAPIVHVRLLARLGSARDRRVIGSFEAQNRVAAAENRLTAIVAAYEKASGAALGELAAQTSAALGRAGPYGGCRAAALGSGGPEHQ